MRKEAKTDDREKEGKMLQKRKEIEIHAVEARTNGRLAKHLIVMSKSYLFINRS